MDSKRAVFLTSLPRYDNFAGGGLPEIALAGKSNVGKSSLINKICGRGNLAKVSGTPGKTRLINVYAVDGALHLIDLPGYGFAKVSKAEKAKWADMMEGYFAASASLAHVLHLVDIRHEPTGEDLGMHAFLRATGLPFTVIATKADKISRAQRAGRLFAIGRALQAQPWQIFPFSAQDGTGVPDVLSLLEQVVAARVQAESDTQA